jgi:hypothetical protein
MKENVKLPLTTGKAETVKNTLHEYLFCYELVFKPASMLVLHRPEPKLKR